MGNKGSATTHLGARGMEAHGAGWMLHRWLAVVVAVAWLPRDAATGDVLELFPEHLRFLSFECRTHIFVVFFI